MRTIKVKRIYKLDYDHITQGPAKGLLTNHFGGYYCIDSDSSYQGWYQLDTSSWQMNKIIDAIRPLGSGEISEFYHQLYGLRRVYTNGGQDTTMLYQKTLLYSPRGLSGKILLTLDHRESYEKDPLGREYIVEVQGNFTLITLRVKKDDKIVREEYIGIRGAKNIDVLNNWREEYYAYNEKRGTPAKYWVCDALQFEARGKVVFSASNTIAEARTLADIAYHHFDDIIANIHVDTKISLPHFTSIYESTQHAAAVMSALSLQQLHNMFQFSHRYMTGIYAGLPWFFQLWSRDELISLGGLIELAKQQEDKQLNERIKNILSRHIQSIRADGTLENRFPKSELGSIDALGWLARRVLDFVLMLQREKKLFIHFSIDELLVWQQELAKALINAKKAHFEDGLFRNNACETWMDTSFNDDGRKGFRIEIQALHYCLYEAIIQLGKLLGTDISAVADEQKDFKEKIRESFLQDGRLIDGFDRQIDWAYRPNIFLAGVIAPELFSTADWEKNIDEHLEKLQMAWGGLSTIEKTNPLFQAEYTGQNNKSYHRGDSWYFVNNLTAKFLHQVNAQKYKDVIKKILDASAKDILDLGLAGCASEVSSAKEQRAEGCLAQAWSAATYIEAMGEIYPLYD